MKCGREGNDTPLQYSRLENPMDGEAWWAAVHGVAKSRTRLRRLSSSSSSSSEMRLAKTQARSEGKRTGPICPCSSQQSMFHCEVREKPSHWWPALYTDCGLLNHGASQTLQSVCKRSSLGAATQWCKGRI